LRLMSTFWKWFPVSDSLSGVAKTYPLSHARDRYRVLGLVMLYRIRSIFIPQYTKST
jgi:hypothetical protein